MFQEIIIKREGIFSKKENESKEEKVNKLTPFLFDKVKEVKKNVTVYDLLTILEEYEEEVDEVFASYTANMKLRDFYEEVKKSPNKEAGLDDIEIRRTLDYLKDKKEFKEGTKVTGFSDNDNTPYAIDFLSLNNIKNANIKLNENFSIEAHDDPDANPNKKRKSFLLKNVKKDFLLHEVIGGFLFEITFYGHPNIRDQKESEMLEASMELDGHKKEEGIYTTKNQNWLKTLKEELSELEEEEKYEEAGDIKEDVKDLEYKVAKEKIEKGQNYDVWMEVHSFPPGLLRGTVKILDVHDKTVNIEYLKHPFPTGANKKETFDILEFIKIADIDLLEPFKKDGYG